MSLVTGIHLLRKLYLVSDTRVTYQRASGLVEVRDDVIKMFVLNSQLGAVAAGHLSLAVFVLERLREEVGEHGYLSDLRRLIDGGPGDLVRDYVNATGRDNQQAGLVFAGFDEGEGKRISSTRLGEVISLPARMAGDGKVIEQPIDRALVAAFESAFKKTDRLDKAAMLEVQVPKSGMFSVRIVVRRGALEVEKKEIACYEYAIYHSDQTFKTVKVSDVLLAALEFRPLRSPEDEIYGDAAHLTTFVRRSLDEQKITTAGGHVFVALQTQLGAIHGAGDLGVIQDGRIVRLGGIKVSGGRYVYTLGDKIERPLRTLNQIALQAKSTPPDEELGAAVI